MENIKIEKEYLDIFDIQRNEEDKFLAKNNVVGVGVGRKITDERETGDNCLSVFVTNKVDKSMLAKDDLIQDTVSLGNKNFKTDVVEVGEIFAGNNQLTMETKEDFDLEMHLKGHESEVIPRKEEVGIQILKSRRRPIKGGYSVGHHRITAGTIASCVFDSKGYPGIPQKYYILSNNHVLANTNDANLGDNVLQPGPYDGGINPKDMIGRLSRYVPIKFEPNKTNLVDAAIAEGDFGNLDREIYWIGYVKGMRANLKAPYLPTVKIGETVQKTGRTTNYSTGKVIGLFATVNVRYGGGRTAKFTRQILTSPMSAPGDSGSLVLDMDNNAVGLLFAGSPSITILNEIFWVTHLLGIRLH